MKKWMGPKPKTCDLCNQPFVLVWIDGKTVMGPWANMCAPCHRVRGVGLGLGKGQKYHVETGEKVEG